MKNKKIKVAAISSLENTLISKERYNPFQCGHGAFKNEKRPSRAKEKATFRKELICC